MAKKKKIILFTHAPQGTLGDPSTALKLLTALDEMYPNEIESELVILISNEAELQRVKKLNIPSNIKLTPHFRTNLNLKSLNKFDAIILYPSPHFFSREQIDILVKAKKPLLMGTEYGFDQLMHYSYGNIIHRSLSPTIYFETGFHPTSHGIFLTQENLQQISYLTELKQDIDMRDFFLGAHEDNKILYQNEKAYFATHHLYFGYFNSSGVLHENANMDPVKFIEMCIDKSSSAKTQEKINNTVDIFLPIKNDEHIDSMTSIDEVFDLLNLPKFHDLKIEYYTKNEDGKIQLNQSMGAGTQIVRIINGFPISADTMDKLIKISQPFCMATGDQSLSEAISNGKLIAYQVMPWKMKSFVELIEKCQSYLGTDSYLADFFRLQLAWSSAESKANLNELRYLLLTYEHELLKEVQLFRDKMFKENNLLSNLSYQLMKWLNNAQDFISESFSQSIDSNILAKMMQLYPNEQKFIESSHNRLINNISELAITNSTLPAYDISSYLYLLEKINHSESKVGFNKILIEQISKQLEPAQPAIPYFHSLKEVADLFSATHHNIVDKDESDSYKLKLFSSLFIEIFNLETDNLDEQYTFKYLLQESSLTNKEKKAYLITILNKIENCQSAIISFFLAHQNPSLLVQNFLIEVFFKKSVLSMVGEFLLSAPSQNRKLLLTFLSAAIHQILITKPIELKPIAHFFNKFSKHLTNEEIKRYFILPEDVNSMLGLNPKNNTQANMHKQHNKDRRIKEIATELSQPTKRKKLR